VATEDETAPDEAAALKDAVKHGRYLAALRELNRLKEKGSLAVQSLDAACLERIQRIGGRYEAGMKLIQNKPSDFKIWEENVKLNLAWAVKLEGDRMNCLTVTRFPAKCLSLSDCCVLEFERDLENHLSDDDIRSKELSKPDAHECSWHRLAHMKSVGSKTDDILIESALDALDEPSKSVFAMRYSPSSYDPAATTDPFGNVLPIAEKGRDRAACQIFFTKLTSNGTEVIRTEGNEIKMPSTIAKILGLMPGFLLKKMFRQNFENQAKYALEYAAKTDGRAALNARKELKVTAPRSQFYHQVHTHAASMECK
jgi:hypothetical protein